MKEERTIDIKGTFEKFVQPEPDEMSQEEAIMKFQEESIDKAIKVTKNATSESDEEGGMLSEEQMHFSRVKQELIASLKRVEKLEKEIYSGVGVFTEAKDTGKEKIKVKKLEKVNTQKEYTKEEKEREE